MQHTLPDLLRDGLDVVFVGINPSVYSVEHGHYFARPGNRFWPCLSRSRLSAPVRAALGIELLLPHHDRDLLDYGLGFTDLVKRPTAKAAELTLRELAGGVDALLKKIERYRPRVACFHGITGYRHVHRPHGGNAAVVRPGFQDMQVGATRLFLAPNPSGANAHFTRDDQTRVYDELAAWLAT